jgi:hypothetical protein
VDARTARRKVSAWLVRDVGNLLMGGELEYVPGERRRSLRRRFERLVGSVGERLRDELYSRAACSVRRNGS